MCVFVVILVFCSHRGWASLRDPRRYGHDASDSLHEGMLPLSVGIGTLGGEVEFCLHRGLWLPNEGHRIISSKQLYRARHVKVVAGERIRAEDNLMVSEWAAPEEWRSPQNTRLSAPAVPWLLSCSVDESSMLTVTLELFSVDDQAALQARAGVSNTSHILFTGHLNFINDTEVASHLEEADRFVTEDAPRKETSKARQSFEQYVIALLQHGSEIDESVRRAERDAVGLLLESAGVHHPDYFWANLEAALKRRIPFEEEPEDDAHHTMEDEF